MNKRRAIQVEISGNLREIIEALVQAGLYESATEIVREALRHFFSNRELFMNAAINMYVNSKATIHLVSKLASSNIEDIIINLINRRLFPQLGSNRANKIDTLDKAVIDVLTLSILYSIKKTAILKKSRGIDLYTCLSLRNEVSFYLMEYNNIINFIECDSINLKGASIQEGELVWLSKKLNMPLLTPDMKLREKVTEMGLKAIDITDFIYYLYSRKNIDENEAKSVFIALRSYPIYVPEEYVNE
jgi:Arc/MetJ-type ribon-helix-helix transcriptional regulator